MTGTSKGRVPVVYNPGDMYFRAGLLLCFTFGILLAGIEESFLAADWPWFWFFTGGEIGCVVLYAWIVWSWLRWNAPLADYKNVDEFVDSPHERNDNRPDQDRDQ